MSDTFIETTTDLEPSQPTESPWAPSPEDWQQLTGELGHLREHFAAQDAERREAALAEQQEELEDLMFEDPAAYAQALIEQRFAEQVTPVLEAIQQQQYEAGLADTNDAIAEHFVQAGIAEEDVSAACEAATVAYESMLREYGDQYEELYEQVKATRPAEEVEAWLAEARRNVATAAVNYIANEARRAQATSGMDEVGLAQLHAGGVTARSSASSGDEMALVAKYMRRGAS